MHCAITQNERYIYGFRPACGVIILYLWTERINIVICFQKKLHKIIPQNYIAIYYNIYTYIFNQLNKKILTAQMLFAAPTSTVHSLNHRCECREKQMLPGIRTDTVLLLAGERHVVADHEVHGQHRLARLHVVAAWTDGHQHVHLQLSRRRALHSAISATAELRQVSPSGAVGGVFGKPLQRRVFFALSATLFAPECALCVFGDVDPRSSKEVDVFK